MQLIGWLSVIAAGLVQASAGNVKEFMLMEELGAANWHEIARISVDGQVAKATKLQEKMSKISKFKLVTLDKSSEIAYIRVV